ncbi:MAG TPA: GNAT family protein [Pyrinomonadaceae bacterium]|nr:GNAT family protein [Pyrinomonadaceae bacterium]
MPPKHPRKAEVVGKRIFLRFLEADDAGEFIALSHASKSFHRGLVSPAASAEQFQTLLERCRRPDMVCFLMCKLSDGGIVGSINLSQIFRGGFQSAYIGYHVGAEFARLGYASEALELVLKFAFEKLRLHRLEANIQPSNRASIALVKRAGFVREGFSRRYLKICGRWRDHERWAIIAEDWKAKRASRGKKRTTAKPSSEVASSNTSKLDLTCSTHD